MAVPVRHNGKWRIRWPDEAGKRQSEVYDDRRVALHALRGHEVRVEEIKLGIRRPQIADKTFGELADYWIERRVPQKRSGHPTRASFGGTYGPRSARSGCARSESITSTPFL